MAATKEMIVSAMEGYSVETTPASSAKVEDFRHHLPEGKIVNVTFLPGTDLNDTVAVCERLAREDMIAVPHIAARSLKDQEQLDDYLAALVSKAGVKKVLVIAGGLDKPLGPFASTMDVLNTGLLEKHGISKVAVAGHPEGSPDISDDELATALDEKNRWSAETGIEMVIETQFCFDAAPVIEWDTRIRAAGNKLPVQVGVPGLATLKTLIKYAQMSGIGPSMRVVTRQAKNLAKLVMVQSPDALIGGLAEYMATDPECGIQGFHFYPFGGLAKSAVWINAVQAGQFDLSAKGVISVHENSTLKAVS